MTRQQRPASPIANLFRRLTISATVIVVFLTIVGFLGGIWWVFDLAAHFRVQYGWLLVPTLALLAVWRLPKVAVLAGAALLVNLALIAPLYLAQPVQPEGLATLEVVTFNVTASNPLRTEVLDYVRSSGADIIFLHEASTDWEDAISRSGLPYHMVSARETGTLFGTLALLGENAAGNVIALGDSGQLSIEVITELDGSEIKVLGTHPLSPVSPSRADARDEQLRTVGEWAAQQDVPLVVTGDFNASTWSRGFSLVAGKAGLVNSQRGFGVQASWPVGYSLLSIPIDHLLHSPELTTVDRRLGDSLGSDHFPLFVTLAWAAP